MVSASASHATRSGTAPAAARRKALSMQEVRWAAARLFFYAYFAFCMITVVGGWLTAPLASWYFYGTWRFWRYLGDSPKLYWHGWKTLYWMARGSYGGFMFDVSLTSPPHTFPVEGLAKLNPEWEHGYECATCTNCCTKLECPILDTENQMCKGFDSFFWRYFNCGRFPSKEKEIEHYSCPKWLMRDENDEKASLVA